MMQLKLQADFKPLFPGKGDSGDYLHVWFPSCKGVICSSVLTFMSFTIRGGGGSFGMSIHEKKRGEKKIEIKKKFC